MPIGNGRYDIVLFSDLRVPGGTSSTLAEEIRAGAGAGYRIGLIHLEAPDLTYPFPLNPKIRTLIDTGLATIVQDERVIETRLAIAYDPRVLTHLPHHAPRVQADVRLLVVQLPPVAADGHAYYDVRSVRARADDTLGGEVTWAPAGPLVRTQFAGREDRPPLLNRDWHCIVDVDAWTLPRERFCDPRPVIGRHSRADRRKWPDTRADILAAYPDDPRFLIRILGGAPFLGELDGACPRNWEILQADAVTPQAFLATIDFFVYFHHSSRVGASGCTIAEAMASGAVVILPAPFRPLFGEGAVYATPTEVIGEVLRFRANHDVYRRQGQCGLGIIAERFSHQAHLRRLEALIGPPEPLTVAVPSSPRLATPGPSRHRPRCILFIASDGAGVEPLTRLLAVARRCRAPLTPVFATITPHAFKAVYEMGFLVEYLPDHRYLGCEIYRWNKYICRELDELIAFYDAPVVVFDGECPYQGLIDAVGHNPATSFVWCRQGMWQAGSGAEFVERERYFDAVLEPRDLACAFDAGLTTQRRQRTRLVAPMRLLDQHEILPRGMARRELGLDLTRPALLIQLSSGNSYAYDAVRRLILAHVTKRSDIQVVIAERPMSDQSPELLDGVQRLRRFPPARWFNAFDAAVSGAGYSAFHELIFAGVPSIFVPHENSKQDDQLARARYAERHGLGWCVRTSEVYRLKPVLDRLLDPEEQAAVGVRCATLNPRNGAVDAVQMIEELTYIYRADRDRPVQAST